MTFIDQKNPKTESDPSLPFSSEQHTMVAKRMCFAINFKKL